MRPKLRLGDPLKYRIGNKTLVVTQDDFSRLDDGEFLNDTIIDFYLKYILDKLRKSKPEIIGNTYVFNTFFYKKLTQRVKGTRASYENVRKWTSKVDLFSMKYVIIPIHEKAHWYVAIICNLDQLVKQAEEKEKTRNDEIRNFDSDNEAEIEFGSSSSQGIEKFISGGKRQNAPDSASDPTIFVLDSLRLKHANIFRPLREYLVAEAQEKRGITLEKLDIKSKYAYAPSQPNYCDCGVYVAHYVEVFLSKPDAFLPLLVDSAHKKDNVERQLDKLYDVEKLGAKREYMQKLILDLKETMVDELETKTAVAKDDNDGDVLTPLSDVVTLGPEDIARNAARAVQDPPVDAPIEKEPLNDQPVDEKLRSNQLPGQ
ncbi:uncharacterized protein V1518DRAFT_287153 [Limtongia smithiae]|uniref:uncharacterized protein n=1 Tax=Limtongia smithiae TaxID=1125753 RepID=UPI0034CE272F